MDERDVESMLLSLAVDELIEVVPKWPDQKIVLTDEASAARDEAVKAARRANQSAVGALSEDEMAQLLGLMNRVIDALQAAKTR
jgi:DNA-binding MarR family transcriptional regulator